MYSKAIITIIFIVAASLNAAVYHVRPDGNNANSGLANSPDAAWRTIDRGQPTRLRKSLKQGQTIVHVVRTNHFPEKGTVLINSQKISYKGKQPNCLTGCENTPNAKSGTCVYSMDCPSPQSGDTIIVHNGIYTSESPEAVVSFTLPNKNKEPITFKGDGWPVIDGRLRSKLALSINGASGIVFEGFDLRRGGVNVLHARNINIKNCHVHGGRRGLHIRYSKNVKICGNKFYDFYGAWTQPPISLGDGSDYSICFNTIALTSHAAISAFGKKTKNFVIKNNIITRSRCGISVADSVTLQSSTISNNCLWNIGQVRWLKKVETRQGGMNYYHGLKFTPKDIHEDPQIISFDPDSPYFLDIASSSPCAIPVPAVGAGNVRDWPVTKSIIGINRIINGSFDANWYGWDASAWQPFTPGQIDWKIETDNGNNCLRIDNVPLKGEKLPSIKSLFFKIDRNVPVYIRFRAKAKAKKQGCKVSMDVGLNVPSWHYGSNSVQQRVHITGRWQVFNLKLPEVKAFYPNSVSLRFTPRGQGTVWIDDVELWQHREQLKSGIKLALKQDLPGALVEPNSQIKFSIQNPYKTEKRLQINHRFITPGHQALLPVSQPINLAPLATKSLAVKIPQELSGGTILNMTVYDNDIKIIDKSYRLLVGKSVANGRNKDFFGINAKPNFRNPANLANAQHMYQAAKKLGIGTLHHYLNIEQMQQLNSTSWARQLVLDGRKCGLEWLWTLQNHKLFTGKRGHIPGPGELGEMASGQAKIKGDGKRLTPEQFKSWQKWLNVLAEKYGDLVKYWEICNEPNCYLKPDEYLKILKFTYPILRKAMPDAKIIGGSLVNAYNSEMWKKTITEGNGYYDYFSFHPYRFGLRNPFYSGFSKHLDIAQKDLEKANNPAKIILTEEFRKTGPIFSDHFSSQEKWEANCLSRMLVRSFAEGCAGYHHHHGYFADWNLTPDLCLTSVHTIASILGNAEPVGAIDVPQNYVAYLFKIPVKNNWLSRLFGQNDSKTVIAIWCKNARYQRPQKLSLHQDLADASITNIFGNKVDVKDKSFAIADELLFINLPNMSPDILYQPMKQLIISAP